MTNFLGTDGLAERLRSTAQRVEEYESNMADTDAEIVRLAASRIEALEARVKTVEGEREAGLNRMDPDRDYAGVSLAEAVDEFTEEHIETWTSEARRWKARAQAAEQSLAEARVALEPFAKIAGPIKGEVGRPTYLDAIMKGETEELAVTTIFETGGRGAVLWADDFRLAASTLAKLGGNTSS